MLKLNNNKIETSSLDDFLYDDLARLLQEIKLAQGGTALDATLKRHHMIRFYLISKQIDKLCDIEQTYFNDDGTLNVEYLTIALETKRKRSCQNSFSDLS